MVWTDRIAIDPQIFMGKPIIKGTRISVQFVIELLAQDWAEHDILANYTSVAPGDIRACLAYASSAPSAEKAYPLSA